MAKVCANCGRELKDGLKFCPYCGTKVSLEEAPKEEPVKDPIENEDEIDEDLDESEDASAEESEPEPEPAKEEPQQEEAPKQEEEKPQGKGPMIVNMIAAGLCLLTCLLFLVGIFGPTFSAIMRSSGSYEHTKYGFKYFFSDMPTTLHNIKEANLPRGTYYSFRLSQYVLDVILFIGGLIGCLVCTIVGIVKNITAITKKKEPNINILVTGGSLRLLSMFFLYAKYATEANTTVYRISSDFGWGGGLIIAGLTVLLVASVGRNVFGAIRTKDGIPGTIIRSFASIMIFIITFAAFSPLTKVSYAGGYYTESISNNGYYYAETVLEAYSRSSSGELRSDIFIPGLISTFFAFAGMLLMFTAFKKSLDEKSKTAPIVNTAISFLFLLMAAVMSLVATEGYREYAGMGSGYIVRFASAPTAGIVLTLVLAIPALIVSNILSKKKE